MCVALRLLNMSSNRLSSTVPACLSSLTRCHRPVVFLCTCPSRVTDRLLAVHNAGGSVVDLHDNLLTGSAPSVSTYLTDYNCFDDCLLHRQPTCLGVANASMVAALVDAYHATGGARWVNSDNWLHGDPCTNAWFGVTCSVGSCPFKKIACVVSCRMAVLVVCVVPLIPLHFAACCFICRCSTLTVSGNGLNGTLPESLSVMTDLQYVWGTCVYGARALCFHGMLRFPAPLTAGNWT